MSESFEGNNHFENQAESKAPLEREVPVEVNFQDKEVFLEQTKPGDEAERIQALEQEIKLEQEKSPVTPKPGLENFLVHSRQVLDAREEAINEETPTLWSKAKSFFKLEKKVEAPKPEVLEGVEPTKDRVVDATKEILTPDGATPIEKQTIAQKLKEKWDAEWERTGKTRILGMPVPNIVLAMVAGGAMSSLVRNTVRLSFGLSGGVVVGAATGAIMGGGKTTFLEMRRAGRERNALIDKKVETLTLEDRETLKTLKGKKRFDKYIELSAKGDLGKRQQELESFSGMKIDRKKVVKSIIYGAAAGAAGSLVASWLFGGVTPTVESHIAQTSHAPVIPEFSKPEIAYTPHAEVVPQIHHVSSMHIHTVPLAHPLPEISLTPSVEVPNPIATIDSMPIESVPITNPIPDIIEP